MPRHPSFLPASVIAARIRSERMRLGLSVYEIARRLGIARQSYQYETGEYEPRLSTLMALKALGMDPRAIVPELFDEGPPS